MLLGIVVEGHPDPASYLTYPFQHSAVGTDKLPIYKGANSAEDCPSELRFQCSVCPKGKPCDHAYGTKGKRACKDGGRWACHHSPSGSKEEVWPEIVNDTLGSDAIEESMAPITRETILRRALGWLVNNFEYKTDIDTAEFPKYNLEGCAEKSDKCPRRSNTYPGYRYLSDCSGFVGMAWMTDVKNPAPTHFLKSTVVNKLGSCNSLCAGDAIVREGGKHIVLFRQWDVKGKTFSGWQMGGEFGKANHFTGTLRSNDVCVRRKNVEASSACPADLVV